MSASPLPPSRHERRAAARRAAKDQQRARRAGRGKHVALALGAAATIATGISVTHVAPASATTTFTVDSTADTNTTGTLRWAIGQANNTVGADLIQFAIGDASPDTIVLGSLLPTIADDVTINGPGAGLLTIDGDGDWQVLKIEKYLSTTPIDVTISGVTIQHGNVTGHGGGIQVVDEHLTLTSSVVSGNYASGDGGGIAALSSGHLELHVYNSVVSDNHTTNGYGGGIIVDDPSSTVSSSASVIDATTIDGNSASIGGGVAVRFVTGMEITNSTISHNDASNAGGGLVARRTGQDSELLRVRSSTISGNSANNGGGVYALDGLDDSDADLDVTTSTIAGNVGSSGMRIRNDVQAVLNSSIVSGTDGGPDVAGTDANVNAVYSLIQSSSSGGVNDNVHNLFDVDPQLGALTLDPASLTGTATMRPAVTSPVVDQGSNLLSGTDQRGLNRHVGVLDMGSVELQPPVDEPTLTLDAASDLGASDTDGITSADDLTFTVSGSAGGVVTLFRDGDLVGTHRGDGEIQDVDLDEGTYTYTVTQDVDRSRGPGEDLFVEVDLTAPDAPGTPDLAAASDHGTSATDNLTNATTRTFDLSGVDDDATVTLRQAYTYQQCIQVFPPPFPPMCFQPTTQYDSHSRDEAGDGTVEESHDPGTTLSATYDAMQTDLAGNSSGYSSSLSVTFDFAAPSVPNAPDLQAASDDGTSTTDNSTTKTALTFDVTGVDPGATATLARVDGQSGDEVDTRTGNGAMTDAGPVAAGTHTYVVAVMDAAGNTSVDPDGLDVTVVAPAVVVPPPPPTTTTTTPATPPTTVAPSATTTSAKASDSTPNAGDTIKLETTPPSGGSTSSTLDSTKPSAAVLLSTNGGADLPMPQPVITKNTDGSVSISVQVPANTPPGVYLIAVMGTTPSGQSRVIIVPVVVRRTGAAARVRGTSVPPSAAAVPTVARSIQASVTALGGSAAVEQAVRDGATLSITGDQLVVDSHPAGRDRPVGPVAIVGLLLAAVALFRRSNRLTRSAR
ncbi:MAG: hypothetical protein JWN67_4983 [Actinomycetia bacterium]|nr:hypothetical protein [Actinomycetes bacterium]